MGDSRIEGRVEWWAGRDLHPRRHKPADLQSAPFVYFGTDPNSARSVHIFEEDGNRRSHPSPETTANQRYTFRTPYDLIIFHSFNDFKNMNLELEKENQHLITKTVHVRIEV